MNTKELCPRGGKGGDPLLKIWSIELCRKIPKVHFKNQEVKQNKGEKIERSGRGTTHMHSILFIISFEHEHDRLITPANNHCTESKQNNIFVVGPRNCSSLVDANTSKFNHLNPFMSSLFYRSLCKF